MYEVNSEREILNVLHQISLDNDVEKIDFVLEVLKTGDNQIVREVAAECLASLRAPEVPQKIFTLLFSEDAYLRNSATAILAKHWPSSRDVLIQLLKHPNKHIRKYALDALYLTSSPDAIMLCKELLNDPEINNVIAAVEYLGKTYDENYVGPILGVLKRAVEIGETMLILTCFEALANLCDERCFEPIRKIIPSPEELPDILIPSYLRLFGRICRAQDSVVLILLSSRAGVKFFKEILDAFKDYLYKYMADLDEIQREILSNWLRKMYDDFGLPSQNKYEILLMLAQISQTEVRTLIPALLQETDFFLNMAAIELIEKLHLTEYAEHLRGFVNNLKTMRERFYDRLNAEGITSESSKYSFDELETMLATGEQVLEVLLENKKAEKGD